MNVHVFGSLSDLAAAVGDTIEALIASSSDPQLGLATGSTFEPVYLDLIARHRRGFAFAGVSAYLLDEYVGLDAASPNSYRNTVLANFSRQVDLPDASVYGPAGDAADLLEEATAYDALVSQAPIELQLLGIGRNGHIGFNEPGSSLTSRTRLVNLSDTTRADNARFFASLDEVPRQAITQGIATILSAQQIILVATGEAKSDAVAQAIEGPVTSDVPASALQNHPIVTFFLDDAAASSLSYPHE